MWTSTQFTPALLSPNFCLCGGERSFSASTNESCVCFIRKQMTQVTWIYKLIPLKDLKWKEKKSMNSHKCAWWMESPSGFSKDGNGNLRTPPPHNLYALPAWAQKRLFLANLSSSPSPKWWVRFSVPKFPAKPDTQGFLSYTFLP